MQPFGLSPLVMKDSLFSGLLKRCVKELMEQVPRQGQLPGVWEPLREGDGPWHPGAGEEYGPTVHLTTWFDFFTPVPQLCLRYSRALTAEGYCWVILQKQEMFVDFLFSEGSVGQYAN